MENIDAVFLLSAGLFACVIVIVAFGIQLAIDKIKAAWHRRRANNLLRSIAWPK